MTVTHRLAVAGAAALILFGGLTVRAQDSAVAKVDGKIITEADMRLAEAEIGSDLGSLPDATKRRVLLEFLIENQLFAEAAEKEHPCVLGFDARAEATLPALRPPRLRGQPPDRSKIRRQERGLRAEHPPELLVAALTDQVEVELARGVRVGGGLAGGGFRHDVSSNAARGMASHPGRLRAS